jgi:Lrp/AsnC family transcriptional regulator, leucine-responsive regulatory protein
MKKIDKKDRKIIRQLDMNARMPINELAKKVQISREVAEYRVKRLTKLGIIAGAHTVFNVDVLGYRSYRLLLRLFNLKQEEKNKLITYFKENSNSWWVASVGGRWDIIMNFVAKDQAEFNDIFDEIVAKFGQYLQDYEVLTYINIHDYSRKYILETKIEEKVFFHPMRYREGVKIDDKDTKIMSLIAKNAQLSFTDIGKKTNLTRNAVKYRIQNLEKLELILGYRLAYHPSKLGYNSYLLLLNINNLKKDRAKTLLEYAKNNPNIIFVVKHIGKYRITLECELENEKKFHELLVDIRDKFNDIITDFDFFPIFYDHKINYFPLSEL